MIRFKINSSVYGDNILFCLYRKNVSTPTDFVTNSYGESWDSSCEQIMSPNPEPMSPSSKNNTYKIENSWAFMWSDR